MVLVSALLFWMLNDWDALSASARLAATLAVPLVLCGVLLVCAGAALAVADRRGTLGGPALLLAAGALLLGGAAWVAASAVTSEPDWRGPVTVPPAAVRGG